MNFDLTEYDEFSLILAIFQESKYLLFLAKNFLRCFVQHQIKKVRKNFKYSHHGKVYLKRELKLFNLSKFIKFFQTF